MELLQSNLKTFRLHLNRELIAILLIIGIFLFFPYLIRQVDGSAAAIDPGIYSAIILALSAILIFKAGTWWIMKAIWPVFAEYSAQHFERNFRSLVSLQKVLIYLGFYLAVFYAFVIVLAALI